MPRFTLSKSERLSSLKEIDQLFKEGKSVTQAPIRLIWMESDQPESTAPIIRVMFSAPKKKFSRAVDRNRIKRLLRECYRLEKNELVEKINTHQGYNIALVFTGNELPDFNTIQKALVNTFERWIKKITKVTANS